MKALMVRRSMWLAAAHMALPSLAWSQDSSQQKRVLMLRGHDPNAPGVMAFSDALHNVVKADSHTRVVFYDELLDLGRFPNTRREEFLEYIAQKYRGIHFNALLTDGTQALQFAIERVSGRFPNVPIVYGLAFEPVVDFSTLPSNVTGIHHLLPFAPTFQMARGLQPDANRVVIIAGSSPNDSLILATAIRELAPLVGGMQLEVWQDWTYASLLGRMRTLPPHAIAILGAFTRDRAGQEFNSGDLIASITRWASGPVYGIARNWVGDGVVGGVTMDFGDDGAHTGRLLLQVLERESTEAPLPQREVARPAQVVDWRALQRWGLSEDRVLPGTKVLFRVPTVWQRYRTLFLALAAVIVAQSALIASLLVERRKRMRALREVQERRAQLAHIGRVATLGELTAAISHELRQPLAAIRANAEAGRMLLDRTPSDLSQAREAFQEIASDDMRALEVIDHIRALVRKDDPIAATVDLNDVCVRSSELMMSEAVQRGVHLRLSLEPRLPPVIGDPVQLQQVVLNLALNAIDAVQASLDAREVVLGTSMGTAEEVEIFVRDTGPGLSPEAQLRAFEPFFSTKKQGLGMGLAIVRTIVEGHYGSVQAENQKGGGAIFRVQLPTAAADSLRARARARDLSAPDR